MRTKCLHIDESNSDFVGYSIGKKRNSNSEEIVRKMKFMLSAVETDLTFLQHYCLTEYYLKGVKQKEIAKALGLSISTVSRHISAGTKKLKVATKYYPFSASADSLDKVS